MNIPEPVLAIAPQAAIAALAAVALRLARARQPAGTPVRFGWEGLAIAVGLAAAAALLFGWNGWWPAAVQQRVLLLAGPAAILAVLAPLGWRLVAPLAVVHVAVALPLLLAVNLRGWSAGQAGLWLSAFGVAWLALILLARATAERLPDAALPAWAAALGVSGYVLADPAASIAFGFAAAGAGLAAGILVLARLRWQDRVRAPGAATALAALAPMFWLLTHELSSRYVDGAEVPLLPAAALAPLALAPLAAWVAWPLRRKPWIAGIVAAIAAAGIAALSLALLPPAPAPDPSGW